MRIYGLIYVCVLICLTTRTDAWGGEKKMASKTKSDEVELSKQLKSMSVSSNDRVEGKIKYSFYSYILAILNS